MALSPAVFVTGLAKYYNSPQYSDILIKYSGGRELHAHKVILANASDYFKTMFESRFQEATSKDITLKEDPPEAFEAMIRFCYDPDLSHIFTLAPSTRQPALMVELYITSGKYLMHYLQRGVLVRFQRYIRFDTPGRLRLEHPMWFDAAARYVFLNTTEEEGGDLRREIVKVLMPAVGEIKDENRLLKKLLIEVPELSFELIKAVEEAKQKEEAKRKRAAEEKPNGLWQLNEAVEVARDPRSKRARFADPRRRSAAWDP